MEDSTQDVSEELIADIESAFKSVKASRFRHRYWGTLPYAVLFSLSLATLAIAPAIGWLFGVPAFLVGVWSGMKLLERLQAPLRLRQARLRSFLRQS